MLKFIKGSYDKIRSALGTTRSALTSGIERLLGGRIDEETLEELEALFFQADLGVETSLELIEETRRLMKKGQLEAPALIEAIQAKLLAILEPHSPALDLPASGPGVLLIVGVNGSGKTTSIAKLAHLFHTQGEKVILGAGDTFRAAAIDQLQMWADRTQVSIVKHQSGSDPAAVVFDTLTAATSRNLDKAIIDTAGRLHTKTDLMEELSKMRRVCDKVLPGAPHETLLVLDATTGQNAIEQARIFNTYTPLTGLILTKLDGTARGGVILPIVRTLKLPVKFIGLGESMDDLQPFDSQQFIQSLF